MPKDEARDRLICDGRLQTSSPFCPRLRRLILERSQALGVHIVDTRNCFYLNQVDSSRWHTQVIGPRIPASRLHHFDDGTCDDISDDDLETWWNLTCESHLATTNLMTAIGRSPSLVRRWATPTPSLSWKWLTDASSSTLECSELTPCCYLSVHYPTATSSATRVFR